jgi:hypothetical protein
MRKYDCSVNQNVTSVFHLFMRLMHDLESSAS